LKNGIWVSLHQKDKPFRILMKQDMMWYWHQLDHSDLDKDLMQTICTSLQTDNNASTIITQMFYRLDALADAQPTVSKH